MPEDFDSFDRLLQSSLLPERPTPRALPAAVPATGQGDWFTSGVMSGFHGALSEGARMLQAGAQLTGATDTAQSLADFAEARHRQAQSYARADLDANPWSLPGIGYQIARMVPMGAAAIGAGALAEAAAPAAAVGAGATALTGAARLAAIKAAEITARRYGLAGASAAMFPSVAGANVERQISETGELTTPGKALVYGVPEAIVQGAVPGLGRKFFEKSILHGIAQSAATQGFAGGATEWLTQKLGDPNREWAERAAAISNAALSGAGLGAIIGGTHRALVGKPAQAVLDDPKAMADATDQALIPPERRLPPPRAVSTPLSERPVPGEPVAGGSPLQEMPPTELWQRFTKAQEALKTNPQDAAALETSRLLGQEFTRRVAGMEPTPEPPRMITYQPGVVPIELRGPITDIPSGELAGRIDVLKPPRNEAEAEEIRQYAQELQRRAAERAAAEAAAPGPQKLLPPPATREGMPLQDMGHTDLMDRFHFVQQWLAAYPRNPRALRANELLAQEFSRRMEEAGKTWTAPVVTAPHLPPLWDQARNIVEPVPPGAPVPPRAPVPPVGAPVRMPDVPEGGAPGRGMEVWRPPASNLPPLWDQARNIVEPAPPGASEQPGATVPPGGVPVQMPAVPQGGELGRGMEVWRPPAASESAAPVAPVEPAAPATPVIDFTKRMSAANYSPKLVEQFLNGPPEAVVKLRDDLIASIIERGRKALTKLQENWARDLDILDEGGKLKEEFRPKEKLPEAASEIVPPQWETPERAAQREQQAAQSTAALDKLRQTLDETRTKPTLTADDQLRAQVEAARAENARLKAAVPVSEAAPAEGLTADRLFEASPHKNVIHPAQRPAYDEGVRDALADQPSNPTSDLAKKFGGVYDRGYSDARKAQTAARVVSPEATPMGAPKDAAFQAMLDDPKPLTREEKAALREAGIDVATVEAVKRLRQQQAESAVPTPAEPVVSPAPPLAREAPEIKTQKDRVAALSWIQSQIKSIENPVDQKAVTEKAELLARLLPFAEGNPGAARNANDRLTQLRSDVDTLTNPLADQVAPVDLKPSPHAAAMPESVDLGKALGEAQSALANLKQVLPGATKATALRDKWLADINQTNNPAALAKLLKNAPETLAAKDETGTVPDWPRAKDLNKVQKERLVAYLNAYERVRQALETSKDPDARARVISARDGLPVTTLDADTASMAQRGVRAVDVANHLVDHTLDPEQAAIAAKLRDALPADTKLIFRDGVIDKEGEYFPRQKIIALYNAANSAATFIHEMVHAVLSRALEGGSAAARAMRGIYDQIKGEGDQAGITDAHEMVAEVHANPIYREWMKSKMVRGTSLWDRFIDAARRMIGLDPRLYNAFDRIMSHGDDLIREQKVYPNEWMGPDSYARAAGRATNSSASYASRVREELGDQAANLNLPLRQTLRQTLYGAFTSSRIVNLIKSVVPAAQEFYDTQARQAPMEDALISQQNKEITKLADRLPPEALARLNKVLALAAPNRLDPEKPLTAHTDILDDPLRTAAHGDLVNEFNELKKFKGGKETYDAIRANGSAQFKAFLTSMLQTHARAYPDLPQRDSLAGFVDRLHAGFVDPADPRSANDQRGVTAKSEAYMDSELKGTMADMTAYREKLLDAKITVDAAIAKKPPADQLEGLRKQSAELGSKVDNLDTILKYVIDRQKVAAEAPYFHLPRSGSHFGDAKLVTDAAGVIDRAKLGEFTKFMADEGFGDVVINPYGKNDTFYVKVRNAAEMRELGRTLLAAQKKGLLSQTDKVGTGTATEVFDRVAPAAVQRVMATMRATRPEVPEGMDEKTAAAWNSAFSQQMQDMQRNLLTLTPENSISRLMAPRTYAQGFASDMVGGQLDASRIMGRGITRMTLLPEISAVIAKMGAQIKEANHNLPDNQTNTKLAASDGVAELMRREYLKPTAAPSKVVEMIRNITHTFHVGASPIYGLMTMTQLATTSLPELGKIKEFGYPAAARELKIGTWKAMRILGAIMKSEDRFSGEPTRETLEKAGLPKELVDEAMGMVKNGDIGTYSTAMTEHSPFSSTVMRAANSMGLYADMLPRFATGFAARALYKKTPVPGMTEAQFVSHAIAESQGAFGSHNNPRYLSHMFGPLSPLVNQFMNWSAQMTGKIYQEVNNSFAGADAKTKSEARRWLAGHAATTTMLAGALGLPALSTASTVADWVLNTVTGRDDWDLQAAFRNFLADTFGKDAGEIIARGLPRAAGMDLARFGEADTLLGSTTLNFMFEKRKLEDKQSDWLKSMGGAGVGEAFNVLAAMRDFSNGDYIDGLIKISPNILKMPMQAYKLGDQGFVDSHGQKLPIAGPRAYDIALTALGIKPQREAEYHEVAREESGLRAMREASSANINQHLRQAWTQGDQESFNTWMGAAQRWQVEHPGMVPPQVSFQRALSTHMQQLARARATGLPIGVQPRDIAGRGMLQYGNIPMQ